MKESLHKNLSTSHPFQSKASSTSQEHQVKTTKVTKARQIQREAKTKRTFGKELQNTEQEEVFIKEMLTPSTLTSLPKSETGSVSLNSPTKRSNPQMVMPYKSRIREFLQKRDKCQKINQKFLQEQEDINSKMRGILVDWLVDVAMKFKLNNLTLFSTINLLDKFLATKQVSRQRLQLIGITCMMIVSKFEEIYPPSIKDYVCVCDKAYTQDEFLDTEADILQTLQFDLAITPSIVFYKDFVQDISLSAKTVCFGTYLLETALLEPSSRKFSNRELACGSIFLVNKIFKCGKSWDKDFAFVFAGISENKVKVCAKELYKILNQVSGSSLTAIKRKFSTVENYEVSKYKVERTSKNKK